MKEQGIILSTIKKFFSSKLSIIFIVFSLLVGLISVYITPREEDPQIVVPVADIIVMYPGASAREVENLVASPLEKFLWQIDGVEYVYSTSFRDFAVVTVRFYVGEDRERSLVKLYNKVSSNIDKVVPGIKGWVIKPIEIDDVPIVNFALYSNRLDSFKLRRVAEEVAERISQVKNISRVEIHGGLEREIRVELDPERLAAKGMSPMQVFKVLKMTDSSITAGEFDTNNKHYKVVSGPFFESVNDIKNAVVGVWQQKTVRLSDVADIYDGPKEANIYTRIGFGPSIKKGSSNEVREKEYPMVTISVAKKKGTNAVWVARDVITKMKELEQTVIPSSVGVKITRNNGKTADDKVNDLLGSLAFAIICVLVLLSATMGWREAIVVSLVVPVSFALSLFVNLLMGYTINRVTLFALILSLGMVVDNPITNVDNIQRHMAMGKEEPKKATLTGVMEVLPPVLMATLAIIVAFLPMFFITGMMGPYMRPMASTVPLTMLFSMLSAVTFVPWLSYVLLKKLYEKKSSNNKELETNDVVNPLINKIYRNTLEPFLNSGFNRFLLLIGTLVAIGISIYLVIGKYVPLKMLPFDNKNEFLIVIDMPEGTTLEKTDAVVRELEDYLAGAKEVVSFQSYIGTHAPIDFNGMVRHYYFRQGPNIADIRVILIDKKKRKQQSHDIILRIRKDLTEIGFKHNAIVKLVEVPPGPPVYSTIVAEVYGDSDISYEDLIKEARKVESQFKKVKGLVDVDITAEDKWGKYQYIIDREKAAQHMVSSEQVNATLRLALSGMSPASLHEGTNRSMVPITCILSRGKRSKDYMLANLRVMGQNMKLVSIGEIGRFVKKTVEQPIYHKNLKRVVYVSGEMAGRAPAYAIFDLQKYFKENPLKNAKIEWAGEGEWKITIDVFRDLGIAFGVALIAIYLLLVIETDSFSLPGIIMLSIPLTAIGIMPGFFILNLFVNKNIGGFESPVFFTATAMIGMIALGGIVIRNAVLLIEFIQDALKEGISIKEAILKSGAVRFRPIMLTAGTTMLGAWPITLDPIFSGLAWSLIFGLFASTIFTLIIVPTVYYSIYKKKYS